MLGFSKGRIARETRGFLLVSWLIQVELNRCPGEKDLLLYLHTSDNLDEALTAASSPASTTVSTPAVLPHVAACLVGHAFSSGRCHT